MPAAFVTVAAAAGANGAPAQLADAAPQDGHVADLPTIVVKPREYHTVPDEDGPAPPVPTVSLPAERAAAVVPAAPAAAIKALTPPGTRPGRLDGTAKAAGGMSLSVDGRPVRLFGVRLPAPRERCTVAGGASQACADAAQAALAAQLAGYRDVICQLPPGQRGEPAFICRDSAGVDLGGYIVAQGFALADTGSSYDYVNAENAARAYHRGVWHQR